MRDHRHHPESFLQVRTDDRVMRGGVKGEKGVRGGEMGARGKGVRVGRGEKRMKGGEMRVGRGCPEGGTGGAEPMDWR